MTSNVLELTRNLHYLFMYIIIKYYIKKFLNGEEACYKQMHLLLCSVTAPH